MLDAVFNEQETVNADSLRNKLGTVSVDVIKASLKGTFAKCVTKGKSTDRVSKSKSIKPTI